MHQGATETHGDALAMMLGGATRTQMAGYYAQHAAPQMAPAYRSTMQQAASGGNGHTYNNGDTYHVHAIDAKSFEDRILQSKHAVRGAVNESYAENSGGADLG
jgi:hypothetical protein